MERIQSLEQLTQEYEKELREMQETRDQEASLRSRGHDRLQAQGQFKRSIRKPHDCSRALEPRLPQPRLELSARSSHRSNEKENEGPRI